MSITSITEEAYMFVMKYLIIYLIKNYSSVKKWVFLLFEERYLSIFFMNDGAKAIRNANK